MLDHDWPNFELSEIMCSNLKCSIGLSEVVRDHVELCEGNLGSASVT